MSELQMYFFYNLRLHVEHTCSFVVSALVAVAHGIIVLLKKSISYSMNIMYRHIFLNFGVISYINKEIVSLF